MSCGKPHTTDCSEVIARVYAYLDGELDEASCDEVKVHLDECTPCLEEYGLDQAVKRLIAKHCGHDPVPSGLREKVMTRLSEVRVELTEGQT